MAAVGDPDLLRTRPMHVDIELRGEHTRWRTVADVIGRHHLPPNAEVGMGLDRARFIRFLLEGLA